MTDTERAAVVAEGLTEAERDAVRRGYGTHGAVVSPAVEPLWTNIEKVSQECFKIGLNAIGRAVRDHLRSKDHED